jgi:hypothetical protein
MLHSPHYHVMFMHHLSYSSGLLALSRYQPLTPYCFAVSGVDNLQVLRHRTTDFGRCRAIVCRAIVCNTLPTVCAVTPTRSRIMWWPSLYKAQYVNTSAATCYPS